MVSWKMVDSSTGMLMMSRMIVAAISSAGISHRHVGDSLHQRNRGCEGASTFAFAGFWLSKNNGYSARALLLSLLL